MNPLQKSYRAFIESVCAELGCRELARPLREGFSAICEASGMAMPDEIEQRNLDMVGKCGNLDIDEVMLYSNYGAHGEPEYQDPDYTERVAYVKRVIGSLKFPLRVWRALKLYPGKELRLGQDIGRYWTYNYDMFYRNKSEQWFANGKWNVILTGTVTEDQVNWSSTITALASDYNPETGWAKRNAEFEICLKRDCIPSELEIDTDLR